MRSKPLGKLTGVARMERPGYPTSAEVRIVRKTYIEWAFPAYAGCPPMLILSAEVRLVPARPAAVRRAKFCAACSMPICRDTSLIRLARLRVSRGSSGRRLRSEETRHGLAQRCRMVTTSSIAAVTVVLETLAEVYCAMAKCAPTDRWRT
jgi:hypothetical protein